MKDRMDSEIHFEPFERAERVLSSLPWAVYRAMDASNGRPVRLAVLWPTGSLPPERVRASLDWFAEAGYQAQRLASAVMARVVSYRSAAEAAWVATAVPPGQTVRELLAEQGPQPADRAMHVSSLVARALADAHAAGWAHGFLNADTVWVDDDVVTLSDLGLGIAAQAMHPDAKPYATQSGLLSSDPRRRDMQCLGLLLAELLGGALPEPVGVPRTDFFPDSVPAAAVKRIRALVNPQADDAMSAVEWAEYARVGEPEVSVPVAPPEPSVPDTRYYDSRNKPKVSWTSVVTAGALVVLSVAVVALWLQQTWRSGIGFAAPSQKLTTAAPPNPGPPPPDELTKVQVGPIKPADEEKNVRALKAMRFQPYIKREGGVLYMQVGAFANADSAKATEDQLRRAGFTVREVK